jgi:copper(I)-binding protein
MERRTSRPLNRGRTAALAAVIAGSACFARAGESTLRVEDAWAAATPPGAVTAAAYMTITSDTADRLVGARSAASRGVEVHAHVESGGVLRMTPIAALGIEPGVKAVLAPGGHHLMLVGLTRPLAPGDEIVVVLEFERAGVREIALPVRDLRVPGAVPTQHDEHVEPGATAGQGGHDHGRP